MVDRMPTRQELQRERAEQILVSLDHFGPSTFDVTYDWGRIRGKMRRKDGNLVDITHLRDQLAKSKSPDSLAIVYCEGDRGYPTDPIEFVCRCEKASDILHSVYRTLRKAADEQLSQQRAGVLAMYVPDIGDFYGLEKESGLQNMTHYLFQKSNASLAAVIYSSDPKHTRFTGGIDRTTQALCFKNSQCKFAEALEYPYVNDLTTRTL